MPRIRRFAARGRVDLKDQAIMTTITEATVRPLPRLPGSSGPKLATHGSPSTAMQGTGAPSPDSTFVRGGVGRHPVRRVEARIFPAAEPASSAPTPLRYPPRGYADVDADVLQRAADASLSPQVFGLVRDGHLPAAKVLMQAYGMSADTTHAGVTLEQTLARTRAPLHDLAMFERFLVDARSKAKRAQVEVPARHAEAPIGKRAVMESKGAFGLAAAAPIESAAAAASPVALSAAAIHAMPVATVSQPVAAELPTKGGSDAAGGQNRSRGSGTRHALQETEVRRGALSGPLLVESPNVQEVGASRFGGSVRPALHVVKRGCVDPVLRVLDDGKEAALSLYSYLFFSSGSGVPVFTKRRVRR